MKIALKDLRREHFGRCFIDFFISNFGDDADSEMIFKKLEEIKTVENWAYELSVSFNLTHLCKEWHENGQLMSQLFIRNGKPDGESKGWYCNDQLRYHCFYKNGMREGEYKSWHGNGKWKCHTFYKNGELQGEYKGWYHDGQRQWDNFYKNGELQGERSGWHNNGKKIQFGKEATSIRWLKTLDK